MGFKEFQSWMNTLHRKGLILIFKHTIDDLSETIKAGYEKREGLALKKLKKTVTFVWFLVVNVSSN